MKITIKIKKYVSKIPKNMIDKYLMAKKCIEFMAECKGADNISDDNIVWILEEIEGHYHGVNIIKDNKVIKTLTCFEYVTQNIHKFSLCENGSINPYKIDYDYQENCNGKNYSWFAFPEIYQQNLALFYPENLLLWQ